MKVIFAGPSLWGVAPDTRGLVLRGPARAGDIARAVDKGARAIGLIDGFFGFAAAVWHKELLYALSRGVATYGAASMGALRAAELHGFGMIPVGSIAADYISGALDDDAAVALTSGPAEMSYMPLTEPLVDALATIANLQRCDAVSDSEARLLEVSARAMFFHRRTAEELVAGAIQDDDHRSQILAAYERHRVFRKRDDALELVRIIKDANPQIATPGAFQVSAFWHLLSPLTPD